MVSVKAALEAIFWIIVIAALVVACLVVMSEIAAYLGIAH